MARHQGLKFYYSEREGQGQAIGRSPTSFVALNEWKASPIAIACHRIIVRSGVRWQY